jgi:hypothetical protein
LPADLPGRNRLPRGLDLEAASRGHSAVDEEERVRAVSAEDAGGRLLTQLHISQINNQQSKIPEPFVRDDYRLSIVEV